MEPLMVSLSNHEPGLPKFGFVLRQAQDQRGFAGSRQATNPCLGGGGASLPPAGYHVSA